MFFCLISKLYDIQQKQCYHVERCTQRFLSTFHLCALCLGTEVERAEVEAGEGDKSEGSFKSPGDLRPTQGLACRMNYQTNCKWENAAQPLSTLLFQAKPEKQSLEKQKFCKTKWLIC